MSDQACDIAATRFATGYNCCQSVLMALAGRYGLDEELAARLGTGFGVGMARGGTCGAVSGAVMLLGLAGGGGGPGAGGVKAATYTRTRDFYGRFIERHGSILCRELIGLDPSTPDGLARAREEKRFETICPRLVGDAVALVLDIMG
jgi:C_GCAxxG_C_C family probable redox protein